MDVPPLPQLAHYWRTQANLLRRRGAPEQALALDSAADDLESAWTAWELEALTLDEAALESGYTRSALEKQVARGDLRNVGEPGSPRVLRRDLPRKPHGTPRLARVPDLAGDILLRRP